jgi:metal-dependent hydrolase (beta-lactamase superfamily II)
MKINVLSNDIVQKRGYIAEHGLSLYIEHGNKKGTVKNKNLS